MKKLFAVAAVAGMAVFTSCGNAEDLAQKIQDSTNMADSIKTAMDAKAKDSANDADPIANAENAVAAANDSAMKAGHDDSVAKGLIK